MGGDVIRFPAERRDPPAPRRFVCASCGRAGVLARDAPPLAVRCGYCGSGEWVEAEPR